MDTESRVFQGGVESGKILEPFGCHCSLALPRVTLQTLGL